MQFAVLLQTLFYLYITMNKKPIILFKYGGNAMKDEENKKNVLSKIIDLKKQGFYVVISHGGGPFIKEILEITKIKSEFIDGQRYTTPEAFKYIEMVLKGQVNSDLVNSINILGDKAVGLSGKDGKTVIAEKRKHQRLENGIMVDVDLGQVGNISSVNTELIHILLENEFIPVIACIGSDENGIAYNINGDTFAGALAGALKADKFVVLTDVDGLLKDKDIPESIIRDIQLNDLKQLKENGIIQGGMIPKTEACETAIMLGAKSAKIINGTKPEQILEVQSKNTGTLITK